MRAEVEARHEDLYLDCVHCGLCLPSCPTYRVLGNETDSPRGRIYLMRAFDEGRASITDSFAEHMFRCLDCRACETVCPSGVQFGHMMEEMRATIVEKRSTDWISRLMLQHVFPHPGRFHLLARLLQLYSKSGLSSFLRSTGLLKRIAPEYAAAEELMPELEPATGLEPGNVYSAFGRARGRVALFAGCVMNSMLGGVNRSTVGLLNAAGYDVAVPADQICCGALANHSGIQSTASEMARTNVAAFPLDGLDAVIVNASGCGAMLAEYPLLVEGAAELSSRVQDLSSFLVSTSIAERLTLRVEQRVGYDDPCHLLHAQGVRQPPRTLLEAVPGVELVEVEGADECCGSAGVYNLTQRELSMEILDRKMERVRWAALDVLVTGNPGCLFQLQYGARRHGLTLEVVHIAEFLARALRPAAGIV